MNTVNMNTIINQQFSVALNSSRVNTSPKNSLANAAESVLVCATVTGTLAANVIKLGKRSYPLSAQRREGRPSADRRSSRSEGLLWRVSKRSATGNKAINRPIINRSP